MHIAIAEARKSNQEFLEDHLQRWGHEVETFSNGAELLQRFEGAQAPHIVLLSWDLPAPSAAEVCRRLRGGTHGLSTHLCLLVGRPRFHEALEAVDEGLAEDCLLLPLDAYPLEVSLATARKNLALRGRLALTAAELGVQTQKDGLTGLWSRDASLAFLGRELAGSRREGTPVSAVLLDLEGLRDLEDLHGFEQGNETLRILAERLRTAVRATDWVGRFARDQLLVVLPKCGEARARSVASRLSQVAQEGLATAAVVGCTGVRWGSAAAESGEGDVDRFIARVQADLAARIPA